MTLKLSISAATTADALFVWECRQELRSSVALALGSDQNIEAHIEWMKKTVSDPERLFLILRLEDKQCGYVRFDPDPDANEGWRVSLCLNESTRGRGIGRKALYAAMGAASEAGFTPLCADIHKSNMTSERVFRSVGFAPDIHDCGSEGYFRYRLSVESAGDNILRNDGSEIS